MLDFRRFRRGLLPALLLLFAATSPAAEPPAIVSVCAGCHGDDDPHEGRFSQDCADCHNPHGSEKKFQLED